jgi:hypothetical protein
VVSLLVAIVACIVAPAATAAADPITSTRSQVQQLESHIAADATHLHQLTVAYNADALQASELGQQVRAASAYLQQLHNQEQQNQSVVRRLAVLSYTGEVQAPATVNLSPLVANQYLDATMGNISDTEDQLREEQRQTAQQLGQLRRASNQQTAQLNAAAAARRQALSQAASEQQTLEGDQQRLITLLAEVPALSRPPAVQGLGTGLVSAVRSQIGPTTTTTPTARPRSGANTLTASPGTLATTAPPPPVTTTPPTTVPTTIPVATTPPPTTPPTTVGGGGAGGPWLALRDCESGDNYRENTGNGFYGAYQFSASTWTGLGYPGRPDLEPPVMQDAAAIRLQAISGWGQWPACSALLGLG